jgi:hypothetical protein
MKKLSSLLMASVFVPLALWIGENRTPNICVERHKDFGKIYLNKLDIFPCRLYGVPASHTH